MRCFYCGGKSDPKLGGRPKCMRCMIGLLLSGVVMVAMFVAWFMGSR